ncbi:MAG: hypothetical protein HZC40_08445 [Chloroflexi bacterium]|nr:hypothetical protein [Chloroflexota bacterium]
MVAPIRQHQTIADIIAQMDQVIARCYGAQSKLGYFAVLYRNVTVRVRDGIVAGRFEDAARMERLDVIFASRYLDALDRFWRGETPTQCWSVAFRAARAWSPIILQHLLLGMNAHINLDLAIAAAQAAPGNELPKLKRDFLEITVLLNEMIPGMEERIQKISPWFRILARVGGRTDEQLCGFAIEKARNFAWLAANKLAETAPEKIEQQIARHDQIVAGLGNTIRLPVGNLLRSGLALIRVRESRDVRAVMNVLQM